jgi:hypothetical protein
MTVALNEDLIMRMRRKPREDTLTEAECIAINLFWRKKVNVTLLAKVFKVSKNTIYYRAITGTGGDGYLSPLYSNQANEVNTLIDKMGAAKAWSKYVTDEMVIAVNQALEEELEQRDADRAAQ